MATPRNLESKNLSMRKRTAAHPSLTLYYWDVNARAEGIRYCLAYGGVEFNDVRFLKEEWLAYYLKASPYGVAPWIEVDGEVFAESKAILQYVAKRSGLWPQSLEDSITALTLAEYIEDARDNLITIVEEELVRMPEDRLELDVRFKAFNKVMKEEKPIEVLLKVEELISKTQDKEGHAVGGELSFADMSIASFLRSFCDMAPWSIPRIKERLPHLYRTMELVYSLPAIQNYRKQHAIRPSLYCKPDTFEGLMTRIALSAAGVKYEYKGEADVPTIKAEDEPLAVGFRPCFLWINSHYPLIPTKSEVNALAVWSLVDVIRNMATSWGTAAEKDRETLEKVNLTILRTQSREGFCVGHSLSIADVAAAAFYEFYMNGHSVGVESENLAGFRNSHRVVFQIPDVLHDTLKYEPTPTFYYFNFPGKGEAIRFLCHAAGIKFNDERLSMASWAEGEHKKLSPNGKLPFMQIGSQTLSEQSAILCYLAARCDMLPTTIYGRYLAQAVESALHDIQPTVLTVMQAKTKDEKSAILKEGLEELLTTIETLVKTYKPAKSLPQFLVEDRLTYVDFLIAGQLAGFPTELKLDLTRWPSLNAVYTHINAMPQIVKYREQKGPEESFLTDWNDTCASAHGDVKEA